MTRPARPSLHGEGAATQRAQLEQQIEEARALHQELEAANLQLAAQVQQTEDARNQALAESARKAAMLDAAIDCVVTMDAAGCITEFNRAAERTFGFSREEVVGRDLADVIVPPGLRDRHRKGLARYLRTGETQLLGRRVEMVAVRRDGTEFPVELAIARIAGDGSPAFTASLRDVTDRVRATRDAEFIAGLDRLLADAHRDYDATLAAVARYAVPYLADYASIDVLTEDGAIRRVAWAHRDATKESLLIELWRRFPYRTSDAVGAPAVFRTGEPQLRPSFEVGEIEAFADDPDRRAMMMALGPSSYICVPLAFGGHVLGALSLVMSDSRRRYDSRALEMAMELARRAAGAVEGARLYRELSEAAARDAFLAEASAVLASSLDYEATLATVARLGVPRLADWCSVYVVDESGALRRLVVAHADPDRVRWAGELERRYRPQPDAPVGPQHVVRTGRSELFADFPDDLIVRIALDADHLRTLREIGIRSSMTVPIVAGDRVLGAIAMLTTAESNRRYTTRDLALAEDLGRRAGIAIDNARLFEEVRRARAEAEAANAAKSAFLTTMSHELRTPLNAIGGYADLLMTGVRGPVSPEQALDLARIRNAGQHLLGLINDVLNYAKLEAVQVRFDVCDVPFEQVVAAAEEMILPQARQRDLTFERARAIPGATVRADPEKVQQILLNLLSNAVKFTPRGGRITVRGTADSGTVRATVSDTGCGIATMELERIFEPFVQVGRGLTTRIEGAGLGLAISRGLARGMGGDLTVASTLGQGSTFTLVLPRGS